MALPIAQGIELTLSGLIKTGIGVSGVTTVAAYAIEKGLLKLASKLKKPLFGELPISNRIQFTVKALTRAAMLAGAVVVVASTLTTFLTLLFITSFLVVPESALALSLPLGASLLYSALIIRHQFFLFKKC